MEEKEKVENKEVRGITPNLIVALLVAVAVASFTVAFKYAEILNKLEQVIEAVSKLEKYHDNG